MCIDYFKERVTTIIGAGAILDFDMPNGVDKPSTYHITQEVIGLTLNNLHSNIPNSIIKDIYELLNNAFPDKVHFEMIFHVLEMYAGYGKYWEKNYNNPEFVPVFAPAVKPVKPDVMNAAMSAINPFLTKILDVVNTYDKLFREDKSFNSWYRKFWQSYKNKLDLFIFNYDTTIEESLGDYEDGFCEIIGQSNFQHFNPFNLRQNKRGTSTICHMHGCINYFEEQYDPSVYMKEVFQYDFHDLYKYPSYDIVKGMLNGRCKSPYINQAGEDLYNEPIITGLRKPDKLSNTPYVFYYGHLYEKIMNNRSLLIVGYSFGDLYVNEYIKRMDLIHGKKKRVVLIDYWNLTNNGQYSLDLYSASDLLKMIDWDQRINSKLSEFICRMSGQTNISNALMDLNNKSVEGPMISSNGCFMLFVGGFRKATNYCSEIFSFLNS